MKWTLFILLAMTGVSENLRAESLRLLLQQAYKNNAALQVSAQSYAAQESLVTAKATLDDPVLGVSTLNRGNETQYAVLSQKIRFPVKYYVQGKAQKNRAHSHRVQVQAQKYKVRRQVINSYYAIFSKQKIIQLIRVNMQAVRDFARVAEGKYAAGTTPQGDSMKAHFELTRLELDLIRHEQEEEALQAELKSILNDPQYKGLQFDTQELGIPTANLNSLNISVQEKDQLLREKSPGVRSELFKLEEAQWNSALSKWEFAPDIQLQYQKRISGLPEDSEIYSIGLSFPLWFWKKGSEASAATAQKLAQQHRVRSELNKIMAQIEDLKGKVKVGAKTLKIYKTSLIPQAQGAYNSSKGAYRASKSSFLDLLDSERSLFQVKTGYYQSLSQYVKNLAQLEEQLGFEISNIEDLKGGEQ